MGMVSGFARMLAGVRSVWAAGFCVLIWGGGLDRLSKFSTTSLKDSCILVGASEGRRSAGDPGVWVGLAGTWEQTGTAI